MKSVIQVVIGTVIAVTVVFVVAFGVFYDFHSDNVKVENGVVVSAAKMDWSTLSVVCYRNYSRNFEYVDIKKFVGNNTDYRYKDGRLDSVIIYERSVIQEFNVPEQLAPYTKDAEAARAKARKMFPEMFRQGSAR